MNLLRYSRGSCRQLSRNLQYLRRPRTRPAACRSRASRPRRGGWCRRCRHRPQSLRTDRSAGTSPWPWRRSSGRATHMRPLIGEALDLARGNRAVFVEPRDDVEPDGVAHAVGDERLLSCAVDADAPAVDLRGAPGAKRLIERVLLVAEAAADIGLDDLNICPGSSQRLTDDPADDVGICVEETTVMRPFSP